jgi:hypothetical protein
MGTEAYHAGAVREMLLRTKGNIINSESLGAITVEQAANKISDLRASLSTGGAGDDDIGIAAAELILARKRSLVSNDDQNYWVPADGNALTFSRTAAQVIKIVTFGATGGTGKCALKCAACAHTSSYVCTALELLLCCHC